MKKLTITIEQENAAFGETAYEGAQETVRIMQILTKRIMMDTVLELETTEWVLLDINGNNVGIAKQEG